MKEIDKQMYYGAKGPTFGKAKELRNHMTRAEELLWNRLSGKQIENVRFRRQHPIDIFIADFYCHQARLVVELDGPIHENRREYDEGRTAEMGKHNLKVIRFNNYDVETDIETVILKIEAEVRSRISNPPWGI